MCIVCHMTFAIGYSELKASVHYKWGLDYQKDGRWSGYTKWDFCIGIFSAIFSTYLGSFYLKYISKIIRYSKFKVD